MINKAMLKAKSAAFMPITNFYNTEPTLFNDDAVFEDAEFPANSSSIDHPSGISSRASVTKWARPAEFCKKPSLFVDGISVSEIAQGGLGDCWFISAV